MRRSPFLCALGMVWTEKSGLKGSAGAQHSDADPWEMLSSLSVAILFCSSLGRVCVCMCVCVCVLGVYVCVLGVCVCVLRVWSITAQRLLQGTE